MKYLDRIYDELRKELKRPYYRNLPLLEAVTVMMVISRAIAESIEIFPYSVSKYLVQIAYSWTYAVAPVIDDVYSSIGYIFSPDVALMRKLPHENPLYPSPVWVISLWSFSVTYTFIYWFSLTLATYGIGKIFKGRGQFLRLLIWTGIAHTPMINWWFYVGCEMLYEIVREEIYMSLLPPYYKSAVRTEVPTPWGNLPNFVPVEGFWFGYGFGVAFMLLTILLIYGLVKKELGLNNSKTLISILPWIAYLSLILVGSLNIEEIVNALNEYVRRGDAWRWIHG